MKLILVIALLASLEGWVVRVINEDEMVIENHTSMSMICYVYYYDGDFKKLGVSAYSESRPFSREGLESVECF